MKANNTERILDWILISVIVVLGSIFIHSCYPYPSTISDSMGYLSAAQQNTFFIFRPFGYSAFLQFIHRFSHSINSILFSQAVLYIISIGIFIRTVKKYYPVNNKWLSAIFTIAVSFSPLALFMLDTIMSDTLFCCMVFIILAMAVRMIQDDSYIALIVFLLAFYVALKTRYSAAFFPFAFIPVFFFLRRKTLRWLSIGLTLLSLAFFHSDMKTDMKKTVRLNQSSTGFSGWQLASNGLHVLPFIPGKDPGPARKDLNNLHQCCLYFKDAVKEACGNGTRVSANFIWNNQSPLKLYMYEYMRINRIPYPVAWAKLGGGLYSDYGKWLILHYPGLFMKHYLCINTKNAFFPTNLEIVNHYETIPAGKEEIVSWFDDIPKNLPLTMKDNRFQTKMCPILPWIEAFTWILLILGIGLFLFFKKKLSVTPQLWQTLGLLFLFGFIYYGSTVFASPIAIRYWMPMHAVKILFLYIVLAMLKTRKIFGNG